MQRAFLDGSTETLNQLRQYLKERRSLAIERKNEHQRDEIKRSRLYSEQVDNGGSQIKQHGYQKSKSNTTKWLLIF